MTAPPLLRIITILVLAIAVAGCSNQQRQEPGGQTALPSGAVQSESAPPGDVQAPGTQNPYP